ncbi:MAG: response regulator [Planctomycetes bacterium]|nr:response regulator [Planctomycetota bacterium]
MKPSLILVVEDNAVMRRLFRLALEGAGFAVQEAPDGQAALEAVRRQPPALILQDLALPDIDGIELVKKLRALPGAEGLPILAVSGNLSKLDGARISAVGFTDLLPKPVLPARLVEAVRALVPSEPAVVSIGRGRLVLVADDDPVQRKLLATQLSQMDFRVALAANGSEALTLARGKKPDALLSDVLMPDLDGMALCVACRQDPALAGLPVVLYSATELEAADRNVLREVGANAFVPQFPHFRPVIAALLQCLSAPLSPPTPPPGGRSAAANLYRFIRQLERQIHVNAGLAHRCAIQATEISILTTLLESMASSPSAEDVLGSVLRLALEINAYSSGAVLMREPDGRLVPRVVRDRDSQAGRSAAELWGHPDFLASVADRREVLVYPSPEVPLDRALSLLTRLRAAWLVVAPILEPDGAWVGALALASEDEALREEGAAFAQALAGLLRQALAAVRNLQARSALEERARRGQRLEDAHRIAEGLAHDFNNVFSILLCTSELASVRSDLGEAAQAEFRRIHKAARHAVFLLHQLMVLGRQPVPLLGALDLGALLVMECEGLRLMLGESFELVLSRQPGLGWVRVDADSLRQVLLCLALNARDAMPSGGRLTLEARNVDVDPDPAPTHEGPAAGRYACLTVSDSGPGMDAGTRAHLFEPFFTTRQDRRGLGLFSVRELVRHWGGHISVESGPGQGSSFRVFFPRLPRPEEVVHLPAPHEWPRGSETLLLLEDDSGVRAALRSVVEAHGYSVLEARNGAEADLLARQHPGAIDLLLADVDVPDMSGAQAAETLRASRPQLKLLYISGHLGDVVARAGISERDANFLQKPFDAEVLLRKLRETLDR